MAKCADCGKALKHAIVEFRKLRKLRPTIWWCRRCWLTYLKDVQSTQKIS